MAVAASDIFTLGVGPWTDSVPDQEIGQFGSVSVTFNLDDGADLSFDVPGLSPTARAIDELATDVWLFQSGVPFVRARIVSVNQTWGPSGEDVAAVTAVDYKRLLNARHIRTPLTFSQVPQSEIVWALVDHAQTATGGDLGITKGNTSQVIDRDRSYVVGENIGSMLANLSGVIDGPWWGIGADLVFSSFPYNSFRVQDAPIMLGATARTLTRQSGAGEFGNVVYCDGDDAETVGVFAESPTLATDPRGRWERAFGFPNVVLQDTLDENAAGLVEQYNSPIATWSCEIEPARYLSDLALLPGDYVQIVVPPSVVAPIDDPGFSVGGQVMSLSLSIDADGAVGVSAECIEVPT